MTDWRVKEWIQAKRASERLAEKAEKERVLANVVPRDPMLCCGVRADLHDTYGCGRGA